MANLFLVVTVDVDPDNFDASVFGAKSGLTWRGVEEGLPRLFEKAKKLDDDCRQEPKYTWFVRCDQELKAQHGSFTYLFEQYRSLWMERMEMGDEIAFHPHVDSVAALGEAFSAAQTTGYRFQSVRMGNAWQTNDMLQALDTLGFTVDSTALPGRQRSDQERTFDWSVTPQKPYYPSTSDYRQPGFAARRILEVPMSMIETKASYDKAPLKRYVNLSFHHEVIKDALAAYLAENDLLVINLHPSELVPQDKEHALLSFDVDTVVKNWRFILEEAKRLNKTVRYVTMQGVVKRVEQGVIGRV